MFSFYFLYSLEPLSILYDDRCNHIVAPAKVYLSVAVPNLELPCDLKTFISVVDFCKLCISLFYVYTHELNRKVEVRTTILLLAESTPFAGVACQEYSDLMLKKFCVRCCDVL